MLPQFLPLNTPELLEKEILKDDARLNRLRKSINAHVWTGISNEQSPLTSLSKIIQRESSSNQSFESYILLHNVMEDIPEVESPIKDRQVNVTRLNIDFNSKNCKLVTI